MVATTGTLFDVVETPTTKLHNTVSSVALRITWVPSDNYVELFMRFKGRALGGESVMRIKGGAVGALAAWTCAIVWVSFSGDGAGASRA